jgi:hypothetical protein
VTSLQGLDTPSIPGASQTFNHFVAQTRLFMRDFPELNRLVAGEETDDRMIAFCCMEALSDFNSEPPHLGFYTFEMFVQKGWVHPLRNGTICQILHTIGLLQTRNHLPFSDGGLNVAVSDKTPLLQSWIQLFCNKWEMWKSKAKVSQNIAGILTGEGGVSSELFAINGYFGIYY